MVAFVNEDRTGLRRDPPPLPPRPVLIGVALSAGMGVLWFALADLIASSLGGDQFTWRVMAGATIGLSLAIFSRRPQPWLLHQLLGTFFVPIDTIFVLVAWADDSVRVAYWVVALFVLSVGCALGAVLYLNTTTARLWCNVDPEGYTRGGLLE